ncbi:MAG: ImmA/IrrE family metallo-endopeptidase [Bacteroidetes bacterium]|nr:ImmA/IrrE family metallo-endopeptidase [Bacteroidota bacterium]
MAWEGEKIKLLVKENRITFKNLAEQVGVSRQAVSDWTKGNIPKGNHLVTMCKILNVAPGFFFSDDTLEAITMPIHRTRKQAKVNKEMQKDALSLAKGYKNLFRNNDGSYVIPVIRTQGRSTQSAIRIANQLREIAGVKKDEPLDYQHAFSLLHNLGITTIFRDFPEQVKAYAFYTKIYDHRVVFVNNSTNILDLIFPLLHEAVHAIRDEVYLNGIFDTEEENFCDDVANHIQFPGEYVIFIHDTLKGLSAGHKINKLKMFGEKYRHSLFGIVRRLKELSPSFRLNVGGADTNLKKAFPSIGEILFQKGSSRAYFESISALSPRFVGIIKDQIDTISYRKLGELLGLNSSLDSKEIKQILSN